MSKNETGWASVPAGKFEAAKDKLFAEFGERGAEIVNRLDDDPVFRQEVKKVLVMLLGEETTRRVVFIDSTTIAVNLAVTPMLSFDRTEVEQHIGEGWAIVEKRADGLYVNGHKVVLYLSKRQQNGKTIQGYDLRKELTGKPVLNVNLLDALYDNVHMIPEDWKKDEQGNTRHIFFWATAYCDANGPPNICCLSFTDGGFWCRSAIGNRINGRWQGSNPAALLAKELNL